MVWLFLKRNANQLKNQIVSQFTSHLIIMVNLLDIPENVFLHHLFPFLSHNDLLRLRRVSKHSNNLSNIYLGTPPPAGHQGKWELQLKPRDEKFTLQAFLRMGESSPVPPASRLFINLYCQDLNNLWSLFEDDDLNEFIDKYSKYVTHLKISHMKIPFNAKGKEVRFYESLTNLKNLECWNLFTEEDYPENLENGNNFLIPSTFKRVKNLKVKSTNNFTSLWHFTEEISQHLESISHPSRDSTNHFPHFNFSFVQRIIKGQSRPRTLKFYNLDGISRSHTNPLDFLRLCQICDDNSIMLKNVDAHLLYNLLCDKESGKVNRSEKVHPSTGESVWNADYKSNLFVGNIIHSLMGLRQNVFLTEMVHLKKLAIQSTADCELRIWRCHGWPCWPNLRKLDVTVDSVESKHYYGPEFSRTETLLNFLCGEFHERLNLEEFRIKYVTGYDGLLNRVGISQMPLPSTSYLGKSCGNLKKLRVEKCMGRNETFFEGLWNALPLLEDVRLESCYRLGDKGFIGGDEEQPVFLKLRRLKALSLSNIHEMPGITDAVFIHVFRHLKLVSLELTALPWGSRTSITTAGIQALFTGKFAEHIEKLSLGKLYLNGLPASKVKQLESLFRSSKML